MLGSPVLEIAAGLAFVYLLLSVVCSAVQEWLGSILDRRPRALEQGIRALLDDPTGKGPAAAFFKHPIVESLLPKDKKPSYISPQTFSTVVLDLLNTVPTLGGAIPIFVKASGGNTQKLRQSLEEWFGTAMERVSGLYKRWTQVALVVIALGVAIGGNVDSIAIASRLSNDPAFRARTLDEARKYLNDHPGGAPAGDQDARKELDQSGISFGWASCAEVRTAFHDHLFAKLAGLLLTAIAVSLGAPFWFDLVSRLVNLRLTGRKPADSPSDRKRSNDSD
jgi:hypothetical protein